MGELGTRFLRSSKMAVKSKPKEEVQSGPALTQQCLQNQSSLFNPQGRVQRDNKASSYMEKALERSWT